MTDSLGLAIEVASAAAVAAFLADAAQSDPGNVDLAMAAREAVNRADGLQRALDAIRTRGPYDIPGHVRRDVSQIQATATKVFGPVVGADAFVLVTEAALMHVHNMPNRETSPLEGPARPVSLSADESDADAHATSWGYRMAARLDYNNAIGAVNLFPYVQWRHDVNGNSPAPSGPFSEGLTALTLGLSADYLSRWRANVNYTRYGGGRNTLQDRDFISASVNYSF